MQLGINMRLKQLKAAETGQPNTSQQEHTGYYRGTLMHPPSEQCANVYACAAAK